MCSVVISYFLIRRSAMLLGNHLDCSAGFKYVFYFPSVEHEENQPTHPDGNDWSPEKINYKQRKEKQ